MNVREDPLFQSELLRHDRPFWNPDAPARSKIEAIPSKLAGCLLIHPKVHVDERGLLVKPFMASVFRDMGIDTHYAEDLYSISGALVARGLHFQVPPHDHAKLVTCLVGMIIDIVVDLRAQSPTYGEFETFELSSANRRLVYVPRGFGHGYYVPQQTALVHYKATSEHYAPADSGLHLRSIPGLQLPEGAILSPRDQSLSPLGSFASPF